MSPSLAIEPRAHGPSSSSANTRFCEVYPQLKSIAHRELKRSNGHTLDTIGLVHELYVKICAGRDIEFAEAAQFLSYSARAMRHILVDRALHRMRMKVGGSETHIELSDPAVDSAAQSPMLALQLDAALTALEKEDARAAQVVELHYFVGLPLDRVGELLGIARRTVDRDWRYARAFLFSQVS